MKNDFLKIIDIMNRISGEEPVLYGISTIGFGVYKYEYSSGRKGEAHACLLSTKRQNNRLSYGWRRAIRQIVRKIRRTYHHWLLHLY